MHPTRAVAIPEPPGTKSSLCSSSARGWLHGMVADFGPGEPRAQRAQVAPITGWARSQRASRMLRVHPAPGTAAVHGEAGRGHPWVAGSRSLPRLFTREERQERVWLLSCQHSVRRQPCKRRGGASAAPPAPCRTWEPLLFPAAFAPGLPPTASLLQAASRWLALAEGCKPLFPSHPWCFLALQGAHCGPDELSSARPSCSQLQIHGTAGGCAGTGTDPAVTLGAKPEGGKCHQHPHTWPSRCHQLLSAGSCPRSRPASKSSSQQGAGYGPAQPLCLEPGEGPGRFPLGGDAPGCFC